MKLQVGIVVKHNNEYYVYASGPGFGSFVLVPIRTDETRPNVPFTPELELKDWNDRPITG